MHIHSMKFPKQVIWYFVIQSIQSSDAPPGRRALVEHLHELARSDSASYFNSNSLCYILFVSNPVLPHKPFGSYLLSREKTLYRNGFVHKILFFSSIHLQKYLMWLHIFTTTWNAASYCTLLVSFYHLCFSTHCTEYLNEHFSFVLINVVKQHFWHFNGSLLPS